MLSSLISPNSMGTSNAAAAAGTMGDGTDWSWEAKTTGRKKKAQAQAQAQSKAWSQSSEWKSQAQQLIFSSNFLLALARSRRRGGGGGMVVWKVANEVLAALAKGRTRWSRAILMGWIGVSKFRKRKGPVAAVVAMARRSRKLRVRVLRLRGKGTSAVQRKVRFLGRLVPGCQKEPLRVILAEASDYIEALEMQVKVMSELAQLLSGYTAMCPPIARDNNFHFCEANLFDGRRI